MGKHEKFSRRQGVSTKCPYPQNLFFTLLASLWFFYKEFSYFKRFANKITKIVIDFKSINKIEPRNLRKKSIRERPIT